MNKKIGTLPIFFIILLLGISAFIRNQVWNRPLSLWSDAVIKSPYKQRPYLNLGIAYLELKRYDEASTEFLKAIEIDPFSYLSLLARYNLGKVYLEQRQYDEAIETFSSVINSNSLYEKAYVGRASAYIEKGLLEPAEIDLMRAKELKPEDATIYYHMGRLYIERGMLDRAIDAYTEAIRLRPNFALAYNNRGVAYAERGDTEKALMDFKKALSLKPDSIEALHNLQKMGTLPIFEK